MTDTDRTASGMVSMPHNVSSRMTLVTSLICPLQGAAVRGGSRLPVRLDLRSAGEIEGLRQTRRALAELYGWSEVDSLDVRGAAGRTTVTLAEAMDGGPERSLGKSVVLVDHTGLAKLIAERSVVLDGVRWALDLGDAEIASLLAGQKATVLACDSNEGRTIIIAPVPVSVQADAPVVDEVLIDTHRIAQFLASPVVPGRQGRPFRLTLSAQSVADLIAYGSSEVVLESGGSLTLLAAPNSSSLVRNGSIRIQYIWQPPEIAIENERLLRQAFETLNSASAIDQPAMSETPDSPTPKIALGVEFVIEIDFGPRADAANVDERRRDLLSDQLLTIQQELGLRRSGDPALPFVARGPTLSVDTGVPGKGIETAVRFMCDALAFLGGDDVRGDGALNRAWSHGDDGIWTLSPGSHAVATMSVKVRTTGSQLFAVFGTAASNKARRSSTTARDPAVAGLVPGTGAFRNFHDFPAIPDLFAASDLFDAWSDPSSLPDFYRPDLAQPTGNDASVESPAATTEDDSGDKDYAGDKDCAGHKDFESETDTAPASEGNDLTVPLHPAFARRSGREDVRDKAAAQRFWRFGTLSKAERLANVDRLVSRHFPSIRSSWRSNRMLWLDEGVFAVELNSDAVDQGAQALHVLSGSAGEKKPMGSGDSPYP